MLHATLDADVLAYLQADPCLKMSPGEFKAINSAAAYPAGLQAVFSREATFVMFALEA